MPQGRVQLDSDWNEWLAELARRIRAGTLDTLGRAVYPSTTPNAFLITPTAGSVSIGVGRMYVDGLLVENHGLPAPQSGGWIPPAVTVSSTQPAWDPALDELVGQNPLDYLQQPYFPNVSVVAPFPTAGGPFLVYLDIWQREITFLEYPDLIEKAVGVDTAGRLQTVWQVRLLDVSSAGNVNCGTKDSDIPPWEALIQPSAGRLTTGVVQSTTSGPCCLAPNTGYTGQENQLYRVEIHEGGSAASKPVATFKWSRDNASVATSVTGISAGGTVLTVQSTGRDSVLRFSPNDWVEITDDWLELNGLHGELHQVALVTDAANTIQLSTAVSAASFPVDANNQTDPTRHTRVVRWDQGGKVYQSDGTTVWTDLDVTGSGEIPVPPPGTSLILENGVTVSFDLNPSTGAFNVGDYWNFAARTVDGTVENLVEAPPRGIHHHYARLAMLTLPDNASDCRIEWPPAGEGGCDCASCVTATSHNSGSWTIQNGIDAVQAQGGGKVCLGPGIYNVAQTITVGGPNGGDQSIAICGHGLPLLLPAQGFSGPTIMEIQNSINIAVEDIAFAAGAGNPTGAGFQQSLVGLTIAQSIFVRVERCSFGLLTDVAQLSPAIALSGAVVNSSVRGSFFNNVTTGIGLARADGYLITHLAIEDNQMYCNQAGVLLTGDQIMFTSELRFAGNFVQGPSGFVLSALGLDVTVEDNTFSVTAAVAGDTVPHDAGVVCSVGQVRIANNEILGNTSVLSVTPGTGGNLPPGTYLWVVTGLDATGREFLVTGPMAAAIAAQGNATLVWAAVVNAASYNVYRTAANSGVFFLDANVPKGPGATITYLDNQPNLQQVPIPAMQNDGIVLGQVGKGTAAVMAGCQIVGNSISGLVGSGIQILQNTTMLATIITQNQLLNLGANGIMCNALTTDMDITANMILNIGLVSPTGAAGILMLRAIGVNVSDNRIEGVGAGSVVPTLSYLAMQILSIADTRIGGNRISDIGPAASSVSSGVLVVVLGTATHLNVANNEIRRAATLPDNPNQPGWLALIGLGRTVSVRGNLLESFAQNAQTNSALTSLNTVASTAYVMALESCLFSDNQCFQDDLVVGTQASNVVMVEVAVQTQGLPIIASGNYLKGPKSLTAAGLPIPSLTLTASQPAQNTGPLVTVLGNIVSSGIDVNNQVLGAPWAPLNVKLP